MVEQWTENPCVGGSIPPLDIKHLLTLFSKFQTFFLTMNSNTINLLITLKNASLIKKEIVFIKSSHITLEIITLLYKEGIIQSFTNMGSHIRISLRYSFNKNIFKNLKTFSNSIDLKYSDICKI